jgi:hypothetical protein
MGQAYDRGMPISRQQTDLLLADLESRIRQHQGGWRDRNLFARKLEYDLRPILDTADDPTQVREWVQAMLLRIDQPADLSYLLQTAIWRCRG